jgi:hypothetical protein
MNLLNRVPALALLIGSIVLLQTHAMDYWTRYDTATGWLWSLVIEGAAIWLWAARNWLKNSIAVFATLLALAAPLYQLAAPVLDKQHSAEQSASNLPARLAAKQAEIEQLHAALVTYNQNSQSRGGWFPLIESTTAALAIANNDLNVLQTEQATAQPASWQAWLQIATQCVALVIIQCLVVLTTRSVFAPLPTPTSAGVLPPIATGSTPELTLESTEKQNAGKHPATGKRLTPLAA